MKRLPRFLTAVAVGGGCSAPPSPPDAGQGDAGHDAGVAADAGSDAGYDAGARDSGPDSETPDSGSPDAGAHDGGIGTPWGDAGCVLPSDFPWDAGFADMLADSACGCTMVPVLHCFEENGPRCFSWACPPEKDAIDGGYVYLDDGGIVCLC
jgi:hypothetical protein